MSRIERQAEPEWMDLEAEAEAYALADFGDVNKVFVERLLELTGQYERANVIDLGTGPGDIPVRVIRKRPEWNILAVDASEAMLKFAEENIRRARLGERIRTLRADAKSTGLPDDAFDILFSNSILHHITDAENLWREIRRIVSDDGFIFLRDLARPDSEERAREIVDQYAAEESDLLQEEFHRSLLSAYTPDEIRVQLEAAGLDHLNIEMVSDRHLDIHGTLT